MQAAQMVFMALLLAHLLGDFPLQPQWIARNKGERLWPLICHGLAHTILAWACLLAFTQVPCLSIWNQIVVVGCVAVHLSIDRLKFRLIARRPLQENAMSFLLDQALHVIVLGIAAFALAGIRFSDLAQSFQFSLSVKAHILEVAIV